MNTKAKVIRTEGKNEKKKHNEKMKRKFFSYYHLLS